MGSALAICCTQQARGIGGSWIGDARQPERVERLEIAIDSGGASATLMLPSWQLDELPLSRVSGNSDGIAFATVFEGDTVRLAGTIEAGRWVGKLTRGEQRMEFELQQLYELGEAGWDAMIGSYRSMDGRLLAIAPFSEFGEHPMLVDYATGRIGPLYPIARGRLLVGSALIAPVFPSDVLDLTFGNDGEVSGIQFAPRDQPRVTALRIATRDEAVRIQSGPITLGGTLTLPAGPPPHPALVLVHGSNALTRDVFGPWSRFFAAHGFAVLSYDKRGTGASSGDWEQADFHALAADVSAGVRFLAARSEIRPDRIGLWGASQAGWILPIVAAEAPMEIAFLIVHAGSGTTVREQGLLNLRNELRATGLPETSVAVGTRYQELDDHVTETGSGWSELVRYYEDNRTKEPWLWPPLPVDDGSRSYYRMLMNFDPSPYWQRVRCPVLLFFGELDANVPPAESWPPIEQALRRAENAHVSHVLLQNANHLFLEAHSGGRDEYPGLSRFVPGYFDRMAEWLAAQAR